MVEEPLICFICLSVWSVCATLKLTLPKGKLTLVSMCTQLCMYVWYNRLFSHRSKVGATGFVGKVVLNGEEKHLIFTCHHKIPNETTAKSSSFMFNRIDDEYEADKISGMDLFDMKDKWFWTDKVRQLVERFLHVKINYVA